MSDSEDSGTSTDEDTVPVNEGEVQKLEDRILNSPYDYSSHEELLKILDQGGDVDRCRQVRERMSGLFPLSPDMWLNWIKQERLFLSLDKERVRDTLRNLYSRAVTDYFSVRLWCQYCSDAVSILDYDGTKIRSLFERALSEVGLHVTQGGEIWDQYRQYETTLYETIRDKAETESEDKEYLQDLCNEQKTRVDTLFQRHLAVPLNGLEYVMSEYKEWLGDLKVAPSLQDRYEKALAKREQVLKYELALENTAPPHEEEYRCYKEYERKQGDPGRVICLMERSITDNPLDAARWVDYLQYLDQVLKIKDVVLSAYSRAVRNIPWVVDVWAQYMLAQQRYKLHFSHIQETLEEALKNGFTESQSYLTLWKCYLDCHWRQERFSPLKQNGSAEQHVENNPLNEAFQKGFNFVNQTFGEEGDPSGDLTRFMAHCEAERDDMVSCRQLMSGLLESKIYKSQSSIWLDMASLELRSGSMEECRKVFQKAIQCTTDDTERLIAEFLFFERVHGTMETYDTALLKCRRQQKKINEKKAKEAERQEKQSKKDEKPGKNTNQKKRKHSTDNPSEPTKHQKTKPSTKPDTPQFPRKPAEAGEIDKSRYDVTIFVSNLSYSATETDLNLAFKQMGEILDIRLVKSVNGNSRGFGYVEFSTREEVMAALQLDRVSILGRPCYVSECKEKAAGSTAEFKFPTTLEAHKLFVNNLPYTMTEEEVRGMFEKVDQIKGVRMVTTKSGKFKGFCYVEYSSEDSAKKAILQLNGTSIGGRLMQVAISNPPKKGTERRQPPPEKEDGTFKRKMKMSMIPRAVSKPSTSTSKPAAAATAAATAATSATSDTEQDNVPKVMMSNLEFSKLFNS